MGQYQILTIAILLISGNLFALDCDVFKDGNRVEGLHPKLFRDISERGHVQTFYLENMAPFGLANMVALEQGRLDTTGLVEVSIKANGPHIKIVRFLDGNYTKMALSSYEKLSLSYDDIGVEVRCQE